MCVSESFAGIQWSPAVVSTSIQRDTSPSKILPHCHQAFGRLSQKYRAPGSTAQTLVMSGRDEQLITKPRTSHCWYGIYFDIEAKESAVEIKAIRSGSSRFDNEIKRYTRGSITVFRRNF